MSTNPSLMMVSSIWTPITSPKTTVLGSSLSGVGSSKVSISMHSRCAGLSATRGGFTSSEDAFVSPEISNSSMWDGAGTQEVLIALRKFQVQG